MSAHTNSDDPTRYMPEDELAEWRARDPIERYGSELRRSGLWDDERHEAAVAAVEDTRTHHRACVAREVDPAARSTTSTASRAPRTRAARRHRPSAPRSPSGRHRTLTTPAENNGPGELCGEHDRCSRPSRDAARRDGAGDERVVLLGEDVGKNGGCSARPTARSSASATDGSSTPRSRSEHRRASIGLSIAGLVPVAEIHSAASPCRPTTSSWGQLARFRYRSRSRYHCPVTVRSAYGAACHARAPRDSVEAPYTHAPG